MLLIACLNVSNLLVARGAARRKELAVRGALGGSRLTLIGEQMTESLLICIAGGTLGLLLSFAGDPVACGPLERSSSRRRDSSGWNGAGVCAWPRVSYGFAGWAAAGDFLHRHGHLRRRCRNHRGRSGAACHGHAAQNAADGGDRAHRDFAGVGWLAVQELSAFAHRRIWAASRITYSR